MVLPPCATTGTAAGDAAHRHGLLPDARLQCRRPAGRRLAGAVGRLRALCLKLHGDGQPDRAHRDATRRLKQLQVGLRERARRQAPAAIALGQQANNLAQLLAMPFALWILSRPPHGRTGLRLTVILATITLLVQSALWAARATHGATHRMYLH